MLIHLRVLQVPTENNFAYQLRRPIRLVGNPLPILQDSGLLDLTEHSLVVKWSGMRIFYQP